jgi:cytidylate kinase
VIMDGRDIGSVICPDAEVKLCLYATPKVRAERRQKELASKGFDESLENCLAEVHKRDGVDESRIKALLDMDDKVVYIDTSDMSVSEVLNAAIEAIGHDKLKVAI